MYAQQLIYRDGGASTVIRDTIDECLNVTSAMSARIAGSLLAVTLPYEVYRSSIVHQSRVACVERTWMYDVSLTSFDRLALGRDVVRAYLGDDTGSDKGSTDGGG